jgi:hypothetical protein
MNPPRTTHTVTAVVRNSSNLLVPGVALTFTVNAGPNAGTRGAGVTDAAGRASFTYKSNGKIGDDSILAAYGPAGSVSATVRWDTPPIAGAGLDQKVKCPATIKLSGISSIDPDPGDSLSYTWTSLSIDGSLAGPRQSVFLPFGSHIFNLQVQDSLGLSSSDQVTIAVVDTIAPSYTFVPPDMVVNTATPAIPPPTATDNCGGPVTITHNAPAIFPPGLTKIIWRAMDASNNIRSAKTIVTYNPPVLDNASSIARSLR